MLLVKVSDDLIINVDHLDYVRSYDRVTGIARTAEGKQYETTDSIVQFSFSNSSVVEDSLTNINDVFNLISEAVQTHDTE